MFQPSTGSSSGTNEVYITKHIGFKGGIKRPLHLLQIWLNLFVLILNYLIVIIYSLFQDGGEFVQLNQYKLEGAIGQVTK